MTEKEKEIVDTAAAYPVYLKDFIDAAPARAEEDGAQLRCIHTFCVVAADSTVEGTPGKVYVDFHAANSNVEDDIHAALFCVESVYNNVRERAVGLAIQQGMKVEDAQEAAARWFNKAMAMGVSRIVTNANGTKIEEMEHVQ